jgi:ribonuclease VapC
MIIDASAVMAILRKEPEARSCAEVIASASSRRVPVVNYVEAAAVIDGNRNPIACRRFDELSQEAQLIIEPVTGGLVPDCKEEISRQLTSLA